MSIVKSASLMLALTLISTVVACGGETDSGGDLTGNGADSLKGAPKPDPGATGDFSPSSGDPSGGGQAGNGSVPPGVTVGIENDGGANTPGFELCAPTKCPKVMPAIAMICANGAEASPTCMKPKKGAACTWVPVCPL